MENTPKTIADLKKISDATSIPLEELQQEYKIYEYSFSSCLEASEQYKGGYLSCTFPSHKCDYGDPKTAAFHKAWDEISRKEQPNVTELNLEESLAFVKVCFKKGEQFLSLVQTLEKNVAGDLVKMSQFFQEGRYYTFYESKECPLHALHYRMVEKLQNHYATKIENVWDIPTLIQIRNEALAYKFGDVRPFPDFFDKIIERCIKTSTSIETLNEFAAWDSSLSRWQELIRRKTASLSEIFPTLSTFLGKLRQAEHHDRQGVYNGMWCLLSNLFNRCTTDSEARAILDASRHYYMKEGSREDPVYTSLYIPTYNRIMRKKFTALVKGGLKNWTSETFSCFINKQRATALSLDADRLWILKTQQALKAPIPDFTKLYNNAHDNYKLEVLSKWNTWGRDQLEQVDTWEELRNFSFNHFPNPQKRYFNGYFIWNCTRDSFSTFILFLQKLTAVAPTSEELMKVLNLICEKDKDLNEYHSSKMFGIEVEGVIKRAIELNTSIEILWQIHEKAKLFTHNNYHKAEQLITDTILEREPAAIEKIFTTMEKNHPLYRIYLRKRVEKV